MLLAGLNYANSIALLLTFLLAGFGLIAMHLMHRNLVGVRGARRRPASTPSPANTAGCCVTLENAADTARIGLECEVDRDSARCRGRSARDATARADVAAAAAAARPAADRTHQTIHARFRSACFAPGPGVHLHAVAARLAGAARPARTAARSRERRQRPAVHRVGDEEWAGLREFRMATRRARWPGRAYARGRGLLVKTYQSPAAHQRMFDFATVPGAEVEQRLEQLSAWIVAAHARGERYGLRLAGHRVAARRRQRTSRALPQRPRAARQR